MDAHDPDPAIAAAMGFSSFGHQRPAKRLKHTPTHASPSAPPKTGANALPIGSRNPTSPAQSLAAEIALPDEAHNDDADAVDAAPRAAPSEPAPTQPPPASPRTQKQAPRPAGLAAFLARAQSVAGPRSASAAAAAAAEEQISLPQRAVGEQGEQGQRREGRMPERVEELTAGELAALRRGVRNGDGDVEYFLPGFIRDPWA